MRRGRRLAFGVGAVTASAVLSSLGKLALIVFAISASSAVALRLTSRSAVLRQLVLLALLVAYHAAVWRFLDRAAVFAIGAVFAWWHLQFVFRFVSQMYHFRRSRAAPPFVFHVVLMAVGPRQFYGADGWEDLNGVRWSPALVREWRAHLVYNLSVIAIVTAGIAAVWHAPVPWKLQILGTLVFAGGLELITVLANLQGMVWSRFGKHPRYFFGNFAWIRSKHVGQFWPNWNRMVFRASQEWIDWLGLRSRYFAGTLAVFLVSGVLHQAMVFLFVREPSYGTLLSFALHGLAVAGFSRLWHRRMPAFLRRLVFNPVTSAGVTLAASQPFILDFYGYFRLG